MNGTAHWEVVVRGRAGDLDHLARSFDSYALAVIMDADTGHYLLRSESLDRCRTSDEALAQGKQHLAVLSGVLYLLNNSDEPLCAGAVIRRHPDGRREFCAPVEPTPLRLTGSAVTLILKDAQVIGLESSSPRPRTVTVTELALNEPDVAKVLRLWPVDSGNWVGLYRIYEVIEIDVGGAGTLQQMGWAPGPNLKRFKHSANSVSVAGDAARHGTDKNPPPAVPMSIEEAKAYVKSLVWSWLEWKGV